MAEIVSAGVNEVLSGVYKMQPEDFVVREVLPFRPEGEGEHVFLKIRKRGHNTRDVQQAIARLAGVPRHHVGYGGLKDRQAITTQWFSVYLPGSSEPDWSCLESESLCIESNTRHRRKLRIGAHSANQFRIVLREVDGDTACYDRRLQKLLDGGFPNYFGEQRFGRDGSNLCKAQSLGPVRKGRLSGKQAMALSAARALIFNRILARREQLANWDKAIPGDLINLDGSNSFFGPVDDVVELQARLAAQEIHPTGALCGVGDIATAGEARALEQAVIEEHESSLAVVHRLQAKPARRPLRARPGDLQWRWLDPRTVQLDFTLGRGVYATSMLAALGQFSQYRQHSPSATPSGVGEGQ